MSKRIAAFCSDLIATSGPLSLPELAARAREAGLTKARNPEPTTKSALTQSAGIVLLPDGRYDAARRMLDGVVLTHRVRAATRDRRVLFAGAELALFDDLLADGPVRLAAGGEVRRSQGEIDGWVGPRDWLPDVPADALLALRLRAGALTVETVTDSPEDLAGRAERVRTVAARHVGRSRAGGPGLAGIWPGHGWEGFSWYRELTGVLLHALTECPDLLAAAVPPLDEVLRLPELSWRRAWASLTGDDTGSAAEQGDRLVLPDVPPGLRDALSRMATSTGLPLGEFAVLQLAGATFHWEHRCRHDIRQSWSERHEGLRLHDDEPPPYSHDLRAYDNPFRADPDGDVRDSLDVPFDDEPGPFDGHEPPSGRALEQPYAAMPAGVVPLTGRAAPAGSSEPRSDRRPR